MFFISSMSYTKVTKDSEKSFVNQTPIFSIEFDDSLAKPLVCAWVTNYITQKNMIVIINPNQLLRY